LAGVSANLLLGRLEEAVRRAALLEQAHPGSRTLLGLAQAYGGAGMHDQAYSLLEQVCVDGFCPEAQVALARNEYERKAYEQARSLRAFMGTGLSNGEPHDFSLRGRQLPDRVAQLDRLRPVRGAWCGQLGDLLQGNHGPRTAHRLEELPVGDAVQPVPQR